MKLECVDALIRGAREKTVMVLIISCELVIITVGKSSIFLIIFQSKYSMLISTRKNSTESLQSVQPQKICKKTTYRNK